MNKGKSISVQITEFLPHCVFNILVEKYNGNKYVRHFTCWNQLLCMIFGQVTNRESLRDLIVAIGAHSKKSYHLGFGKRVMRSNLDKVNMKRNAFIFKNIKSEMIYRNEFKSFTYAYNQVYDYIENLVQY
ncbi:MAG: DUF4372 domain-containing protein [Labilibaculum sp.]|nr:DUF4372 domain-containing protein [Labilibaculum sp.]